jgi:hypothetical protein
MKCNQCEYLFINGVGCHETGCTNGKVRKCFECGCSIPENCDGNCMQPVEEETI